MAEATLTFPPDFRWGTATSAYQVEGHNENSDWWRWEAEPGRILAGGRSGAACDWWDNAEADLDLAAELGTNAIRIGLEWSRIEPEPSVFSAAALDRYREILQGCHDRGLEPMVTLHHFSNPQWLVEKGDFGSEIVVDYFRRYTAKVVECLGDLVPIWITINEPITYAFLRYLSDAFPTPPTRGLSAALSAVHNMLRCHAAAYHTIKAEYPAAPIGVAGNMAVFEPRSPGNPLDRWWAKQVSRLYNNAWFDATRDGVWRPLAGRKRIPHLAGTADFVGVNYYTRFLVRFPPPPGLVERDWGPDAVVSDGDYGEVYPYGLYRLISHVWKRYGLPIYITENGVPDAADRLRPAFILDHLRQIWHAVSFCFPVMGYYHWTLVDNFEWERGWTQRFGLVALDPATQERTWRPSAHLYQEICRSGTLSSDMAARYAPELLPIMFPGAAPEIA
jgi:beta-glucosidase